MKINTVILCGGKSSRFNFRNKALLKYNFNKTFLDKIIEECGENVYLSIDDKNKYIKYSDISMIEDIYKDIGPIGGIYSSFINLYTDYIQFLSCDTPSINNYFLNFMKSMIDEYHDIFIPVYNNKSYFLCSIYSKNVLDKLNFNIKNGEYSIKKLLKYFKVKYIDLTYTNFKLFNINTNDDYVEFKKTIPQYFSICGKRNSGKTTLICKLIREFNKKGKSVSVIKHTSHDHSFDIAGKDTYNFKSSGALASLIYSPLKYMLVKDYNKSGSEEENLFNFISSINDSEIIILEGFKYISNIPKIEVFRKDISNKPICEEKELVALVTDDTNYSSNLPIFNINDISSLVNFIFSNIIF